MNFQNNIFVKNKDLAWRTINDETIIIPLDKSNNLFSFNKTATAIWNLIDGKNTLKNIVNTLYKKYNLNEEKYKQEIYNFINKLYKEKLILKKDSNR